MIRTFNMYDTTRNLRTCFPADPTNLHPGGWVDLLLRTTVLHTRARNYSAVSRRPVRSSYVMRPGGGGGGRSGERGANDEENEKHIPPHLMFLFGIRRKNNF